MVQTARLIKALEKIGHKIEVEQREIYDHCTGKYFLSSKTYYCQSATRSLKWHDQEGKAICIQSMDIKERNQAEIDYFPGWFCKTIKDAINSL